LPDGKARHLDDAVATIRAYYAHGGAGFHPIGLDLVGTHAALIDAGRTAEASQVVRWLDAARPVPACVDAFNGRQPHRRLNDIAIRR
jgi:hypothetical protein